MRKRSNDVLKVKKKKHEEVSSLTSSKRTPTMESSRSPMQVEAPTSTPTFLMTGPSKSLEAIQPASPASLIISLGIARSSR